MNSSPHTDDIALADLRQWAMEVLSAAGILEADVDAELLGVLGIECMLGIDEGADVAGLLGVGDGMERHRRLARGLGAVDLDDAALGRIGIDPVADLERLLEKH